MTKSHIWSIIVALNLAACTDDSSQRSADGDSETVLRLTGEPACEQCQIKLEPIAVLGHPLDPASVRADAAVAGCKVAPFGDDGAFLVAGAVGGGELLVYEQGDEPASTVGRRGAGPGELGSDFRIITVSDTIILIDNSNARIITRTMDGEILQSVQLPRRVNSVARLPNGDFVIHGRLTTGRDQPVIDIIDASGQHVASLGRTQQQAWDTDQWVIGNGASADYWAVSMWNYQLYRGSAQALVPAAVREVDWFPADNVWSSAILETEPASPLISYVHETDEHLLWVFVALADPDWASDLPDAGSAQWFRDAFDTMVEVIDLESRTVLANHRVDDYLGGICGTPMVYAVTPEAAGHVSVTVYEPSLER